MKNMKNIVLIVLMLLLSSCSIFTNDFASTNALIAQANVDSRKAYADGMAACKENAACQVGVTSSYFSNAGQQKILKPETVKDYMEAGLPYANLASNVFLGVRGGGSGGSNSGGFTLVGDNNTVNDIGNHKTADNGSTLSSVVTLEHRQDIMTALYGDATKSRSDLIFVPPEETEATSPPAEGAPL